jgi:hypothetical protein
MGRFRLVRVCTKHVVLALIRLVLWTLDNMFMHTKCLHCAGIEPATSCVVGECSHHYATSGVKYLRCDTLRQKLYLEFRQSIKYLFTRDVRITEELDSPAVSALGVRSRKLSNALNGQSWDG